MNEMIMYLSRFFRGEDTYKLANLVAGYYGEQDFYRIAENFKPHNSILVKNFIFEFPSFVQIDALVITEYEIHLYEVKNYDAHCSINDGRIFYDNKRLNHNPLFQITRAVEGFKNILHQEKIMLEVKPHLVFMHPFGSFETDGTHVVSLMTRNQLREHFRQMINLQGGDSAYSPISLYEILKAYQIADWHNPHDANPVDFNKLKRGIYCLNCGSFRMKSKQHAIKCLECGHVISKKLAINYLIAECSALYPNDTLCPNDIFRFSDGLLDRGWVYKNLAKNLEREKRGYYYKLKNNPYTDQMLELYSKLKNRR